MFSDLSRVSTQNRVSDIKGGAEFILSAGLGFTPNFNSKTDNNNKS